MRKKKVSKSIVDSPVTPEIKSPSDHYAFHGVKNYDVADDEKKSYAMYLDEQFKLMKISQPFLTENQIKQKVREKLNKAMESLPSKEKHQILVHRTRQSTGSLKQRRVWRKSTDIRKSSSTPMKEQKSRKQARSALVPLEVSLENDKSKIKGIIKKVKRASDPGNRPHVTFNSQPEIHYRTGSEASTGSLKKMSNQGLKTSSNFDGRPLQSELDKSEDDLVAGQKLNPNCSWSYKSAEIGKDKQEARNSLPSQKVMKKSNGSSSKNFNEVHSRRRKSLSNVTSKKFTVPESDLSSAEDNLLGLKNKQDSKRKNFDDSEDDFVGGRTPLKNSSQKIKNSSCKTKKKKRSSNPTKRCGLKKNQRKMSKKTKKISSFVSSSSSDEEWNVLQTRFSPEVLGSQNGNENNLAVSVIEKCTYEKNERATDNNSSSESIIPPTDKQNATGVPIKEQSADLYVKKSICEKSCSQSEHVNSMIEKPICLITDLNESNSEDGTISLPNSNHENKISRLKEELDKFYEDSFREKSFEGLESCSPSAASCSSLSLESCKSFGKGPLTRQKVVPYKAKRKIDLSPLHTRVLLKNAALAASNNPENVPMSFDPGYFDILPKQQNPVTEVSTILSCSKETPAKNSNKNCKSRKQSRVRKTSEVKSQDGVKNVAYTSDESNFSAIYDTQSLEKTEENNVLKNDNAIPSSQDTSTCWSPTSQNAANTSLCDTHSDDSFHTESKTRYNLRTRNKFETPNMKSPTVWYTPRVGSEYVKARNISKEACKDTKKRFKDSANQSQKDIGGSENNSDLNDLSDTTSIASPVGKQKPRKRGKYFSQKKHPRSKQPSLSTFDDREEIDDATSNFFIQPSSSSVDSNFKYELEKSTVSNVIGGKTHVHCNEKTISRSTNKLDYVSDGKFKKKARPIKKSRIQKLSHQIDEFSDLRNDSAVKQVDEKNEIFSEIEDNGVNHSKIDFASSLQFEDCLKDDDDEIVSKDPLRNDTSENLTSKTPVKTYKHFSSLKRKRNYASLSGDLSSFTEDSCVSSPVRNVFKRQSTLGASSQSTHDHSPNKKKKTEQINSKHKKLDKETNQVSSENKWIKILNERSLVKVDNSIDPLDKQDSATVPPSEHSSSGLVMEIISNMRKTASSIYPTRPVVVEDDIRKTDAIHNFCDDESSGIEETPEKRDVCQQLFRYRKISTPHGKASEKRFVQVQSGSNKSLKDNGCFSKISYLEVKKKESITKEREESLNANAPQLPQKFSWVDSKPIDYYAKLYDMSKDESASELLHSENQVEKLSSDSLDKGEKNQKTAESLTIRKEMPKTCITLQRQLVITTNQPAKDFRDNYETCELSSGLTFPKITVMNNSDEESSGEYSFATESLAADSEEELKDLMTTPTPVYLKDEIFSDSGVNNKFIDEVINDDTHQKSNLMGLHGSFNPTNKGESSAESSFTDISKSSITAMDSNSTIKKYCLENSWDVNKLGVQLKSSETKQDNQSLKVEKRALLKNRVSKGKQVKTQKQPQKEILELYNSSFSEDDISGERNSQTIFEVKYKDFDSCNKNGSNTQQNYGNETQDEQSPETDQFVCSEVTSKVSKPGIEAEKCFGEKEFKSYSRLSGSQSSAGSDEMSGTDNHGVSLNQMIQCSGIQKIVPKLSKKEKIFNKKTDLAKTTRKEVSQPIEKAYSVGDFERNSPSSFVLATKKGTRSLSPFSAFRQRFKKDKLVFIAGKKVDSKFPPSLSSKDDDTSLQNQVDREPWEDADEFMASIMDISAAN